MHLALRPGKGSQNRPRMYNARTHTETQRNATQRNARMRVFMHMCTRVLHIHTCMRTHRTHARTHAHTHACMDQVLCGLECRAATCTAKAVALHPPLPGRGVCHAHVRVQLYVACRLGARLSLLAHPAITMTGSANTHASTHPRVQSTSACGDRHCRQRTDASLHTASRHGAKFSSFKFWVNLSRFMFQLHTVLSLWLTKRKVADKQTMAASLTTSNATHACMYERMHTPMHTHVCDCPVFM